jgi:TRAP-type C4-dicarboxylate transport system permease large subunit
VGLLTPPFGMSMFVTSRLAGISIGEFVHASVPFVVTMILVLLLVTAIPALVLWLPNTFMGLAR